MKETTTKNIFSIIGFAFYTSLITTLILLIAEYLAPESANQYISINLFKYITFILGIFYIFKK